MDRRFFFTSMTVAFFASGIGMREAVFMLLERLPGLGREKLAGDGLCRRESDLFGEEGVSMIISADGVHFCEVATGVS